MIFEKFNSIKAFVLDVDGVLTDGHILVNEAGEQWRSFHVKDGYAMQLAVKKGYIIIVITGGKSQGVFQRLSGLGVQEIHMGISHKESLLTQILSQYKLGFEDILYIGDDCPDLNSMKLAGVAVAPADAVEEVKAIADYISPIAGGQGIVRSVIEKVMRLQHTWSDSEFVKSI